MGDYPFPASLYRFRRGVRGLGPFKHGADRFQGDTLKFGNPGSAGEFL
jgi:hypothetical protein